MLQLVLWFVTGWERGRETVICEEVRVKICYIVGVGRI